MGKWLARWILERAGWKIDSGAPPEKRFVLVCAPHTSNWDFLYFILIITFVGVKISWIGKHVLFAPPLGWIMRRLGGIPVERRLRGDVVSRMTRIFAEREEFALAIAAEGTRSRTSHWRSGFYHIARAANVPVVPGYLDYSRRRGGFGPAIYLTGDIPHDMDGFREFFADKVGRHPEKFGEVRLREEMLSDER
ncbi:MAG: lysophospholipid acyltransferase family protein [Candidatus Krumholzibacteriota bacterium]|nr:lysophospholipid acyltransferase family protein [Candidatus Krumholzibacteriota bacterium]